MSPRITGRQDALGLEHDRYHHCPLLVLSSLVFILSHQLSHSFFYFSVVLVERRTFILAKTTLSILSNPQSLLCEIPRRILLHRTVKMRISVGLAALIASVAYAAPLTSAIVPRAANATTEERSKLQLIPIANESRKKFGVGRNIAPTRKLDLSWKTPDEASLVSVNLDMQHPAVILEDIDDVTAVDCIGQTRVAVTFSDKDAFDEALEDWSGLNDSFVMVTNHQGDCDAELERSFFVADTDSLAAFESNLTIIAKAEKSDVYSTASKTTT